MRLFFIFGILECLWRVTTLACWGAFIFNLLGYIRERLIEIIFHASASKSVFCYVFFLPVLFVLFMEHEQRIKANVQYLRE